MIPIRENYKEYAPPKYVQFTITKLLVNLPPRYLSGLGCVVLTNRTAIGKGKTKVKGRKDLRKDFLGFYHPKSNQGQAWIEIIVDNIVASFPAGAVPRLLWRVLLMRELKFAETLFHEIGHHLDYTIGAPARSGEPAAKAWEKRLFGLYVRKRYWYLVPFTRFALPVFEFLRAIFDRETRRRRATSKAF